MMNKNMLYMSSAARRWHVQEGCLIVRRLSTSKGFVLGVMRETYNLWERRAPLCPRHVASLMEEFQSSGRLQKIIVQPSSRRAFTDNQYECAGAVVQEDLTDADFILGVKRPLREDDLLGEKAYCFFSHVIKGQPENMDLLKHILDNKIQLFDYECIVEGGMRSDSGGLEQKQKRLVAFGMYAGIAGANDALHALGRRLLHHGISSPLLHIPPTYTYTDINAARGCLRLVGQQIQNEGITTEPLVVCVTGKGGKAHMGAMEVLQTFPHKIVTIDDLASIAQEKASQKCLYLLPVGAANTMQHKSGAPFDRKHYQENPQEYYSIFSGIIAKHVSVLVNASYWNERFPRLLTRSAMRKMYSDENALPRLQVVADISCDVGGSIEFLHRVTSIERPFYEYDPRRGIEIIDDVSGGGVTVSGVDILPSELPIDSSAHFGDTLLPFVRNVIQNSDEEAARDGISSLERLPPELRNACIASNGELMHGFKYIEALMSRQSQPQRNQLCSMILSLEGHLFDTALINQSLDVIEGQGCQFHVIECDVRRDDDGSPRKSRVVLKVSSSDAVILDTIHDKIEALSGIISAAGAVVKRLHEEKAGRSPASVGAEVHQNILILGSGMVSNGLVDYLGRNPKRQIVVAGLDDAMARSVASRVSNGKHVAIDVLNDAPALERLIRQADVVVSFLPATLHPMVAKVCIDSGTNLVTASYESKAMRDLHLPAKAAGITIINEVGLDPGLDHMSAMRMIDNIHARGGTVRSFRSFCGGLPSPCAADNPLRYKFSWNPRGALGACVNDAKYKANGVVVHVPGENLLSTASHFQGTWSKLDLEYLPNRDSLAYLEKYGIHSASTCFRGTLRYSGYSSLMNVYRELGFFRNTPVQFQTWGEMMDDLQKRMAKGGDMDELFLSASKGDHHLATRVRQCSQYLQLLNSNPFSNNDSVIDSFAHLLEEKLSFRLGESDMVLMHNEVIGSFDDGTTELLLSTLKVDGDEIMSAMSKTVGYTTAVATDMLLNKEIPAGRGLLLPTSNDIYLPILDHMKDEQILFAEHGVRLDKAITRKKTTTIT